MALAGEHDPPRGRRGAREPAILRVRGNSIEPEMREGDQIMVDVSRRLPSTGETFVLWDGNGLVIKQVEAVHGDAAGEDESPRLR